MAAERENPELTILRKHIDLTTNGIDTLFDFAHNQLEQLRVRLHRELESIFVTFKDRIENRESELQQLKAALLRNQQELKANALAEDLQKVCSILEERIKQKEETKHNIPMFLNRCHYKLEDFCTIEEHRYTSGKQTVWSWGGDASSHNKLSYPNGLALDENTEEIFIVDKVNNRIQVCSFRGEHLRSIGNAGLDNPVRIALSRDSIYISQRENALINCFNRGTSQCIQRTRVQYSPSDLKCYNNLFVYVCEYNSPKIQMLHPDLADYKTIKLQARDFDRDRQIDNSHTESLEVTENGIWVLFSDCVHPLQCFSLNGEFIKIIISEDKIERAFYFCLDTVGNILVSDYDANRIKVFSSDGEILATIGRDGQVGSGEICHPQGIGVTRRFNIVVVDWKQNHPLQFFD